MARPWGSQRNAPTAFVAVAAAAVTALILAGPARAADMLLWENGGSYTTFGANEQVVIGLGTITFIRGCANPDFVTAFTDAYVVPNGSVTPGAALPPIAVGGEPHVIESG
jgi:hypothetical protein